MGRDPEDQKAAYHELKGHGLCPTCKVPVTDGCVFCPRCRERMVKHHQQAEYRARRAKTRKAICNGRLRRGVCVRCESERLASATMCQPCLDEQYRYQDDSRRRHGKTVSERRCKLCRKTGHITRKCPLRLGVSAEDFAFARQGGWRSC